MASGCSVTDWDHGQHFAGCRDWLVAVVEARAKCRIAEVSMATTLFVGCTHSNSCASHRIEYPCSEEAGELGWAPFPAIADAIALAGRIMARIDNRWPEKP